MATVIILFIMRSDAVAIKSANMDKTVKPIAMAIIWKTFELEAMIERWIYMPQATAIGMLENDTLYLYPTG